MYLSFELEEVFLSLSRTTLPPQKKKKKQERTTTAALQRSLSTLFGSSYTQMAPPTILCVRHAQGLHNLGLEFHGLVDPRLTPLGEKQCAKLRDTWFRDQSKISLVTASPLTRTLHTAFLTFLPALENGKAQGQILALPDAQETSDYPCDTGSDVPVLQAIVDEQRWPVDLRLVRDGWNVKTMGNRYSPASDAIKARARDTRKFLRRTARELLRKGDQEVQIALVTHGGYLHYFTNDWEDSNKQNGTGWENCETRAYVFESLDSEGEDDEALLVETDESRRRRGKEHPMHPPEKQAELFHQSMQGWEDQGLQNPSKLGPEYESGHAHGNTNEEKKGPIATTLSVEANTETVQVVA